MTYARVRLRHQRHSDERRSAARANRVHTLRRVRLRRVSAAVLGACAILLISGSTALAAAGDLVDFTRLQIDCRKSGSTTVTPFMEMDVHQTWNIAAGTFTGTVFNVSRTGTAAVQIGTISGQATATSVAFKVIEALTDDATGTLPPLPASASGPRATPVSVTLTGPVTVTGKTGDHFACLWTAAARLTTLPEVAVAPVANVAAADTLGPVNQPAAQAPTPSGGGVPLIPVAIGALVLVGGIAGVRAVRSAAATRASDGSADALPARQRFQDQVAGFHPTPVDHIGGAALGYDPQKDKVIDLAKIEARTERSQAQADSELLTSDVMAVGEGAALFTGVVADQGVERIKQVTGTPGKVVAYTYAGAKAVAGDLAEGKSAAEAFAQGGHDAAKAMLDDQLQDGIGGVLATVHGAPGLEIADSSAKSLSQFAKDGATAAGKAQARQATKNYVASEATSAATDAIGREAQTPPDQPKAE
jgi:hypothetical protein